ncbi:MAG: hypothetical protein KC589_07330 [Nanoarchaeota archaeon]|nr:hypothetical protein [Nanoarchaeota archaeon]MCA9496734.1 hypothetical protein [Nanoarchaeota archaeon]
MSEWKTLKQETIEAGGNNFLEVNVKQPPEGENVLIGISKGWFTEDGQKRYKTNILFSKDKRDELIKVLSEIDKDL